MKTGYIFLIFIFICIVSCDNSKDKPLNNKQLDSIQSFKQKNSNDTTKLKNKTLFLDTNNPIQKKYYHERLAEKNQKLDIKDNITTENLTKLLTFDIPEFIRQPISVGTFQEKESITTYAKAQFINRQSKSTFVIDIFDYGKNGNVPNPEVYKTDYTKNNINYMKIGIKGFTGGSYIDTVKFIGRTNLMIGKRLTITIRAENYHNTLDEFYNLLNLIDLKQIANISKQK